VSRSGNDVYVWAGLVASGLVVVIARRSAVAPQTRIPDGWTLRWRLRSIRVGRRGTGLSAGLLIRLAELLFEGLLVRVVRRRLLIVACALLLLIAIDSLHARRWSWDWEPRLDRWDRIERIHDSCR
jgi:hypothetical protein